MSTRGNSSKDISEFQGIMTDLFFTELFKIFVFSLCHISNPNFKAFQPRLVKQFVLSPKAPDPVRSLDFLMHFSLHKQ